MSLVEQEITYFRIVRYRHVRGDVDDYSHLPRPRYSFAYIEKGEVVCQSCGKTVRARAGDVLFVPYGVTYASHWMGDPETVFCSCFFMVRPFSPPYGDSTFELQSIGRCEALYPDFLFLLQHGEEPEAGFSVLARLYALLDALRGRIAALPAPRISDGVRSAVQYIDEHLTDRITVGQLARVSNLSVPHFHSRFRREMGVPPIAYKNRVLIDRACRMLLDDLQMPIEELSARLGFESAAYFRRVFRAQTGQSPREYRRTNSGAV